MDFVRTPNADKDALAPHMADLAFRASGPTPLSELVAHFNGHGQTPGENNHRIASVLIRLADLIDQGHIRAVPESPIVAQNELFMPLAGKLAEREVHPVDHAVHSAARRLVASNDAPTLGLIDRELNRGRDEMARVGPAELLRALARLDRRGYLSIGERMAT